MSSATLSSAALEAAHRQFEAAVPQIDRVLPYQFRRLPPGRAREACADARAAAWHAWYGLLRRGQDPLAVGPSGIATNACRYVRNGRRLGTGKSGRSVMDVFHPEARRRCGFQIVHAAPAAWREWTAETNRVTVVDQAAFRVDFAAWLAGLPARKRQMAELLVLGHETGLVAKLLGVTPAAVSLSRSWLEASWRAFQGETLTPSATTERRGPGRPRKTNRPARARFAPSAGTPARVEAS
jgi:DNA-directed RNA polymerase specialized sigma24 family protein